MDVAKRTSVRHWAKTSGSVIASLAAVIGASTAANAEGPGDSAAQTASAEPSAADGSEIVVTANRRASSVQKTPLNIAAVTDTFISQQGLENLADVTRFVPGISVVDQGPRQGNTIIVRGLNATGLSDNDGDNIGGGTVAVYIGEIPLFVDLKLNDIERVEFLLGPQGTLYGAGTLGGAIRYIPKRPKFSKWEGQIRGDAYGYSVGSGISTDLGATINVPLSDNLAVRGSIDYLNDRGFIDQPYLLRTPGVSRPDPDFSNAADAAANLFRKNDTNTERTLSGRFGIRWQPTDAVDLNLTYYYQNAKVGGRRASGTRVSSFPVPVGRYESVLRFQERAELTNQLLSFEAAIDLGFADLTSATGVSRFEATGNRDQTDLLIALAPAYALFPAFSIPTREERVDETFTQEARLVSKGDGRLNWIVGGYFNRTKRDDFRKEFAPGLDLFYPVLVPEYAGITRPDNVEYFNPSKSTLQEYAGYGELGYKLTDAWQVTVGARYFSYDFKGELGFDFPLEATLQGRTPNDAIVLANFSGGQKNSGWLFKLNSSYTFSPEALAYATVSQGYRIGSSNQLPPCPADPPPGSVCGSPSEQSYNPDKTVNYELGLHSQWFDRRLTVNGAIYFIKWSDPQVESVTAVGQQGIRANGGNAESKGLELDVNAQITPRLSARANYAYNDTRFTEGSANLIEFITPPGFATSYLSGVKGDRLPGSPRHRGSASARYEMPIVGDMRIALNYGVVLYGSVLTRTGGKGGSYTLPAYDLHNASLEVAAKGWKATLYADNLFNSFIETSARRNASYNQVVSDINGSPVYQRGFYTSVLPPRRIGVRLEYQF